MKSKTKKTISNIFASLCLCLCILLSNASVVKATELPCNLVVTIVDSTNACDATVNLMVSTISGVQQFSFTSDLWGEDNAQTLTLSDFGKANITITTDKEGWRVVEADSLKEVTSLEFASNTTVELSLIILPTSDNAEFGDVGSYIEQGEDMIDNLFDFVAPSEETGNNVSISGRGEDITGADEVYQNFLDKTAILTTDKSWDYVLNTLHGTLSRLAMKTLYLDNVKGATEEQWNNMSAYEIFVYTETYLRFANMVGSATNPFDEYLNNGDTGLDKYLTDYVGKNNYTGTNCDEVLQAIKDVAEWQGEFVRQYNYPYNFITGKSYAEERGIYNSESEEETTEDLGLTSEEESEIKEALSDDTKQEHSKSFSIWKGVADELLKHWFSIIIAVVLVVAYLVVRHIRKKKAIDDMSADGK